jgi:tetratricopeptide (TPR) repeat protein
MLHKILLLGGLAAVFGVGYVALRPSISTRQVAKAAELKRNKDIGYEEQMSLALSRKDYAGAEKAVSEFMKANPGETIGNLLLGNVYFDEGRKHAAWEQYRVFFSDLGIAHIEEHLLVRYGDLALAEGDTKSAKEAYNRVIDQYRADPIYPVEIPDSKAMTLTSLQATAIAIDSRAELGAREPYLDETERAATLDPSSALVAYVRADALYKCGLWADAREEFDRSIELSPSPDQKRIEERIDRFYKFSREDHVSTTVIGKNGKLTVTRKSVPLPNVLRFVPDSKPVSP